MIQGGRDRIMDKKKILLIDDEKDFCFFVKNNLELTGEFQVITAIRAEEGINLARKERPDLILLDIVMPTMEGSDVAAVLLSDPRTRQIPVVFLTAVVTQEEIGLSTIKEIGGHSFIAKPVDTESLSSCIKITLRDYSKT
jgi:CheY-like chemotaxis protein